MTVEEIERLLAEFYEGNTNEQEEELLKEAFRTEEVPEHLQKDKKLFLSFFPFSTLVPWISGKDNFINNNTIKEITAINARNGTISWSI